MWEELDGKRAVLSEGSGVAARRFPLSVDVCSSAHGWSKFMTVRSLGICYAQALTTHSWPKSGASGEGTDTDPEGLVVTCSNGCSKLSPIFSSVASPPGVQTPGWSLHQRSYGLQNSRWSHLQRLSAFTREDRLRGQRCHRRDQDHSQYYPQHALR